MKSSGEVTWSVGEVAERFGMPTHVLRHWESEGLLEPDRDGGGRRRYDRDDIARVAAIRRQKDAGMSLEQIRVLLDASAPERHAVLRGHLSELDRRSEEIRIAREMTEHAYNCKAHDLSTCPGFQAHVADLLGAFDEGGRSVIVGRRPGRE